MKNKTKKDIQELKEKIAMLRAVRNCLFLLLGGFLVVATIKGNPFLIILTIAVIFYGYISAYRLDVK